MNLRNVPAYVGSRAVVLCRDEYIRQQDLPAQLNIVSERTVLNPNYLQDGHENKMRAFESEMISEALKRSHGNQRAAARILNISERHLRSRLEKLGLKNKSTKF